MLQNREIIETIDMIRREHLDIRTLTMGISLFDCVSDDTKVTSRRVYDKIVEYANDIPKVADKLSSEYGIPIVNKRVAVTPVSLLGGGKLDYQKIALALDNAAKEIGIDFIGGYTALVHKGMTEYEKDFLMSIPYVLRDTSRLCSSVNVGTSKAGINMDAVRLMGEVIKKTSELTADKGSVGCAKLVVFCNAVEDNPFMAGAFHGIGEADKVINVGVSGPGVVHNAIKDMDGATLDEIAESIKKTAFKITRSGELIAKRAAEMLGAKFGIVDLSLAPTAEVGDSVAHILEAMGLEQVGGCGTTAALALLNDAVKKGGLMASSSVGGLSGAFIPVSEDIGMINAAENGNLTINKLEAMTAVCSVGLDMIAIPGDTPASVISALIADEAAIGMVNSKTTAVRLIPAVGRKAGDVLEFGGLLGSGPVMPVRAGSPEVFINRGGRIPAPIQALKN